MNVCAFNQFVPIALQAIARQVGIIDQDKWDKGRAIVVKGTCSLAEQCSSIFVFALATMNA